MEAQSGQERSAPVARSAPAAPGHRAGAALMAPPPGSAGSDAADAGPGPLRPAVDFAAEYQKSFRVLWVVAAGVLGRSAGAEDAVQEAALLGLKKIEQFEPGTHFAAWMAQMVRFVALNQLRKQTRTQAAPLDERDAQARPLPGRGGPPGPARELRLGSRGELPAGQHSLGDDLVHALADLTDVARACLLLRTIEGLDYAEIGKLLAIPEGTAMSHVHRSRLRLRERLGERHGPEGRPQRGAGGPERREGRRPS